MEKWIALFLVFNLSLGYADEGADPVASELEQLLLEFEHRDAQLTQAKEQLKSAPTPAARRPLKAQIEELEAQQERLLERLEQIVGPLPLAVRSEPPSLEEERLRQMERRHESVLESDVEKRLPR